MGMFNKPINGFKTIANAWKRGNRLQASITSAAVASTVAGAGIAGNRVGDSQGAAGIGTAAGTGLGVAGALGMLGKIGK